MSVRRDYPCTMYMMWFMLLPLLDIYGQDLYSDNPNAVSVKARRILETSADRTSSPTTQSADRSLHMETTALTLPLINHHLLFDELIHETLLKKDFHSQQAFFTERVVADMHPTSATFASLKVLDPAINEVTPETDDASVFSELATAISMTTSTPLTELPSATETPSAVTPLGIDASDGRLRGTPELANPAFTIGSLTTAAVSPVLSEETAAILPNNSAHALYTETPKMGKSEILHISPGTQAVTFITHDTPAASTVTPRKRAQQMQSPTKQQSVAVASDAMPVTSASGDDEETTTTTIITTTTITTLQSPVPCNLNFTSPEGYIESPEPSGFNSYSGLECTYFITVYIGYGVEIKVWNISLAEGEMISVESVMGEEPIVLANVSLLMKGQVIRSPGNQVAIHFQSPQLVNMGSFQFQYQAYLLSCGFPQRPSFGDVSVTSLHPGGEAYFYCDTGYQIQGETTLSCINATRPFWNDKEPQCVASCGGVIRNATLGRIISPGFPGNYSNNLTCHWLLEAPEGQRLHLHFEKVLLAEDDDRLIIRNGDNIDAPPVYDSFEVEYLPIEGIISGARHFFLELTTDSSGTSIGIALRYEAFAHGHCYEPYVKNGNFSTSDSTYAVGTTVEFSCDPGYTLEQGSVIIECLDINDPQWNETEPACRAVCSGDVTESAGVILSPNWPEAYDKGQDCIWGVHVEEDKRMMLDIQVLNIGKNDVLTIYDGDDLTARIMGQFTGVHSHLKLYTSMADATIQFQSDPASPVFGYLQGFVIHFFEIPRNDTCPELPEIQNGWKMTSHPDLIHGTIVTYQCYPGYDLVGTELLMCQWDLSWSADVPTCEKTTTCPDPGDIDHSRRVVSSPRFLIGSTVQYICNKGYVLTGSNILTCYSRQSGAPKWSDRLPKCVPEMYEPCRNPGVPDNGFQSPEKRTYQAGEVLRFSCYSGYEVTGEANIRCVPGHPSQWSHTPPVCKASYDDVFNARNVDVAKAAASNNPMEGANITTAIFIPVVIVIFVIGGLYLYFAKLQGKSPLQLPLTTAHPYDHITVESAFENPIYETGVSNEPLQLQVPDPVETRVFT
ncbi:seizure protein 6 homolog isoform X2 [Protopterus annectens]|uniref:seizure protein 6 homolog isoform X2 n=1 Tax=Protopterus annectens TaxID=7888 RepID=UPI001CFB5A5C|nr:seizure protein 6 homolog isoform X2 [Protopterus annectens]